MKQLLAAICWLLFALQTHGQKLYLLKYKTDTIRYKQMAAVKQRYDNNELRSIMGGNSSENSVINALLYVQRHLDNVSPVLSGGQPASDPAIAEHFINNITEENFYFNSATHRDNEENPHFDISNYKAELHLYRLAIKDISGSDDTSEKRMRFDEERLEKANDWYKSMTFDNKKTDKEVSDAHTEMNNAKKSEDINRAIDKFYTARYKEMMRECREKNLRDSISSAKNSAESKVYFEGLKKKYGAVTYKKAMDGNVWVGMPEELAQWGAPMPDEVKVTEAKSGRTITWIFYDKEWRNIVIKNKAVFSITY